METASVNQLMCDTIYNNATGEDIGTPRQLRELVGLALLPPCAEAVDEDYCLCDVDVAGLLTAAGIDYEVEYGTNYAISWPSARR